MSEPGVESGEAKSPPASPLSRFPRAARSNPLLGLPVLGLLLAVACATVVAGASFAFVGRPVSSSHQAIPLAWLAGSVTSTSEVPLGSILPVSGLSASRSA